MKRFHSFYLYVVQTNPLKREHHGLRTNTAPYVLARNVSAGDSVVAALYCTMTETVGFHDGDAIVVEAKAHLQMDARWQEPGKPPADSDSVHVQITSALGRSVQLGEDGAEEAIGKDVLPDLFLEALLTEQGFAVVWNYAPINATPDTERYGGEIHAKMTRGNPWTISRVVAPQSVEATL